MDICFALWKIWSGLVRNVDREIRKWKDLYRSCN